MWRCLGSIWVWLRLIIQLFRVTFVYLSRKISHWNELVLDLIKCWCFACRALLLFITSECLKQVWVMSAWKSFHVFYGLLTQPIRNTQHGKRLTFQPIIKPASNQETISFIFLKLQSWIFDWTLCIIYKRVQFLAVSCCFYFFFLLTLSLKAV